MFDRLRGVAFEKADAGAEGGEDGNKGGGEGEPKTIFSPEQVEAIKNIVGESFKSGMSELSKSINTSIDKKISPLADSLKGITDLIEEAAEEELEAGGAEGGEEEEEEEDDIVTSDYGKNVNEDTKKALGKIRSDFTKKLNETSSQYEKRIKTLETELESERKEKEAIAQSNLLNRMNREMSSTLSELDVRSVEGGIKWFQDAIVYDEDSDSFMYQPTEADEPVPLKEGLANNLPEFLVKPARKGDGSGSGEGGGRGGSGLGDLNTKKESLSKDLAKKYETAKATGDPRDLNEYRKVKRELENVEKQIKEQRAV